MPHLQALTRHHETRVDKLICFASRRSPVRSRLAPLAEALQIGDFEGTLGRRWIAFRWESSTSARETGLDAPSPEEFLQKADWGREHGFLSELVHAWSPYDPPRDVAADAARLQSLFDRLQVLLRQHLVTLGGYQHAYLGQVDLEKGEVLVATLSRPPG